MSCIYLLQNKSKMCIYAEKNQTNYTITLSINLNQEIGLHHHMLYVSAKNIFLTSNLIQRKLNNDSKIYVGCATLHHIYVCKLLI